VFREVYAIVVSPRPTVKEKAQPFLVPGARSPISACWYFCSLALSSVGDLSLVATRLDRRSAVEQVALTTQAAGAVAARRRERR
jgi:hypothetical protein